MAGGSSQNSACKSTNASCASTLVVVIVSSLLPPAEPLLAHSPESSATARARRSIHVPTVARAATCSKTTSAAGRGHRATATGRSTSSSA